MTTENQEIALVDQLPEELTPKSGRETMLANLAALVNSISREISLQTETNDQMLHLTASEINVMSYIDRHPGTLPRDAALDVGLQRSNMSVVLRGLTAKGLVDTIPDREDGRKIHLYPTNEASRNLDLNRARWSTILHETDCDQGCLCQCLDTLTRVNQSLMDLRRKRAREGKPE